MAKIETVSPPSYEETLLTADVEIRGLQPGLLMNCPNSMGENAKLKIPKSRMTKEQEAETVVYKMDNGELYIPATAIKGSIVHAGKYGKYGRGSAYGVLSSFITVEPFQIPLGTKDYEIDVRSVVIQRSRVLKARPWLPEWTAKFQIIWNDAMIPMESLKGYLKIAGHNVGVLDFRPETKGDFGKFDIVSFGKAKEYTLPQ